MHSTLSSELGLRIKMYRQLIGLTQEELAEKAGFHHTYIGQVERGEKNITINSLQKITFSLEISISDLFKDIEEFRIDKDNIALDCYHLICEQSMTTQKHIYQILLELNKMV